MSRMTKKKVRSGSFEDFPNLPEWINFPFFRQIGQLGIVIHHPIEVFLKFLSSSFIRWGHGSNGKNLIIDEIDLAISAFAIVLDEFS